MMTTTFDSRLFDEPNRGKARKLLEICGPAASSPFETLIDRLELPGAEAWVGGVLGGVRVRGGTNASDVIADGVGGIPAVESLKAEAKARMRQANAQEEREAAVLLYTLAVGAAVFHHGAFLSTRPRGTVVEHLFALAGVLTGPYGKVAEAAAARI